MVNSFLESKLTPQKSGNPDQNGNPFDSFSDLLQMAVDATTIVDWSEKCQAWDQELPAELTRSLQHGQAQQILIGSNSLGLKAGEQFASLLSKCSKLEVILVTIFGNF